MQTIEGKTQHRQSTVELAAAVDDRHARIEDKAKDVVTLAKEAGDVLCTLKRRVREEDGEQWMEWVRTNLEPSYDSVVRYMRIARRWKRLEPAVQANPRMTLDEAVNLIIDKKRPIKRQPKECDISRELLRHTFGLLIREIKDDDVAWLAELSDDATSRLDAILQQALNERTRSSSDHLLFRTDNAPDAATPAASRSAVFDAELLRGQLQARTLVGMDGEDHSAAPAAEISREEIAVRADSISGSHDEWPINPLEVRDFGAMLIDCGSH